MDRHRRTAGQDVLRPRHGIHHRRGFEETEAPWFGWSPHGEVLTGGPMEVSGRNGFGEGGVWAEPFRVLVVSPKMILSTYRPSRMLVSWGVILTFWAMALGIGDTAVAQPSSAGIRKPSMADTIRASIYADNWFSLYINGELVAVDSIAFIPHNVIEVDLLPRYPMTIAVMARDNADPKTGMEYANTNIGDAGFILKFSDGTVTNGRWKAKCFSRGPIDGDTRNPRVEETSVPANWFAVGFDDSAWAPAREYSEEDVDPKQPFYEADFEGATFIWTDDVRLDNTVIFRHTVTAPPDGRVRPDFSRLNDVVPEGPPRSGQGGGRRPPGTRPPPGRRPSPEPPR